ncbi:MAG TPA: excinuclease ABC subunit UvrC [Thermodesulfovibrionales bacterium]|jgi:excinuclease ABC subunit C|nr:excinuclease ABC subunit UvrC [Thermodesulfovibrionales bacterium]
MPQRLSTIPSKPGVYVFNDTRQKVLYVGKAKNLRNRIRSYFQKKSVLDPRKASMMRDVHDFSYIVTGNELEAFVLEANLIKQYKPRFNIILRDDKNYPYLKLTVHEEWPGIEVVRKIIRDGALYFGPYVPAGALWDILAFIRRNFRIRDCRFSFNKPMKPCIQHQMGRCVAPCTGYVSREDYGKLIDEIRLFLNGEKKDLIGNLQKKMLKLSEEMKYEEAAGIRDRIRAIERAMEAQKIIAPELGDIDVIGFHQEGSEVLFKIFFIRKGIMIGSKDFLVHTIREFPDKELLHEFIMQFYAKEIIPPAEIAAPVLPEEAMTLEGWLGQRMGKRVRIRKPVKGKKRELVDMAMENANFTFRERRAMTTREIVLDVQGRLNLVQTPGSIGGFDISNISGDEAVGAFVYWEEGAFDRDRYRRMRIKTVRGVDDYSMMEELIERIIRNLEGSIPDLLLIDGGKGHLEIAKKVVEKNCAVLKKVPELVAVAKDPDRAFLTTLDKPVNLEDRKRSSLLLKSIRDEAHRAAVGYHRKLRGKALLTSPLESVTGIGKKRRLELLRVFGSVENIKNATIEAIAGLKGFNRIVAENLLRELR